MKDAQDSNQMAGKESKDGIESFESTPAASEFLNTPDEIETFGREYFAEEFPNPERLGCPSRARLSTIARSMKAPDKELQQHLFSCSGCFNEFRVAMSSLDVPSAPWWQRILTPRVNVPVMVALGVLAISMGVAGFLIYRETRQQTGTMTGNQANANPAILPSVSDNARDNQANISSGATIENKGQPKEAQKEISSMVTARVDLRSHSALGSVVREGQSGESTKPIRLAAARMRLSLNLPAGSRSGVYIISVLDRASLNPVISARASSANGKSLETILNLDHLRPDEYVLRLARAGESPSDFGLVIYRTEK